MVSSDLIDIVIGVVLAWFVLSLIVSFLGEAFSYLSKTRSKLLWRSLSQLFDSAVPAADARLRSLLFRVPFGRDDIRPVATTEPSVGSNARDKLSTVKTADPVSVDDETIAKTKAKTPTTPAEELYDILRRRVPDPASGSWRTRISQVPTKVVGDALQALAASTVTRQSLLASVAESSALRAKLETAIDAIDASRAGTHDHVLAESDVRDSLGTLSEDQANEFANAWASAARVVTLEDIEALLARNPGLLARVRAAARGVEESQQVVKAREEIERWFDGAMEGLSTFYRRQSRKILAVIALVVVLCTNSGAFHLFQRLHDDNDLRVASATAAANWAAEPLANSDDGSLDLSAACARITASSSSSEQGAATSTSEAAADSTADTLDPLDESRRRFKCVGKLFASTDLLTPIGPRALWSELRNANGGDTLFGDVGSWMWHDLIGRVVTWMALLFGASFWYDALRRIIGLKGKLAGGGGGST